MVTIRSEHITGYPRTSGRGRLTSLTVHQTGNTGRGANARAHANLQARGAMPRNSWHATVDDTQAIESYPDDAKCWHAGNATGNASSYSVELCVNSDGNYARMLTNAAEFIAKKLHDLGLDPGDVVQHNHWSGKDCPTQIRAGQGGVNWTRFLAMIRDAYTPTPDPSEEDDMPSAQEIAKAIWNYEMDGGDEMPNGRTVPRETAGERLRQVRRSTDGLQTRTIKALLEARERGVTEEQIEAAVTKALSEVEA